MTIPLRSPRAHYLLDKTCNYSAADNTFVTLSNHILDNIIPWVDVPWNTSWVTRHKMPPLKMLGPLSSACDNTSFNKYSYYKILYPSVIADVVMFLGGIVIWIEWKILTFYCIVSSYFLNNVTLYHLTCPDLTNCLWFFFGHSWLKLL